jgi:hypothetical protein
MASSRLRQNGIVVFLIALLALAGYGVFATRPEPTKTTSADSTAKRVRSGLNVQTDQATLDAVEQLLRLPTRPEERSYAQRALRLASNDADLAFVQSLRLAAARKRSVTPEVKQLTDRLTAARKALAADSDGIAKLKKLIETAKPADKTALGDRLQLAQAMAALDAEEVNDAHQDLIRAGGDPQARTQARSPSIRRRRRAPTVYASSLRRRPTRSGSLIASTHGRRSAPSARCFSSRALAQIRPRCSSRHVMIGCRRCRRAGAEILSRRR